MRDTQASILAKSTFMALSQIATLLPPVPAVHPFKYYELSHYIKASILEYHNAALRVGKLVQRRQRPACKPVLVGKQVVIRGATPTSAI